MLPALTSLMGSSGAAAGAGAATGAAGGGGGGIGDLLGGLLKGILEPIMKLAQMFLGGGQGSGQKGHSGDSSFAEGGDKAKQPAPDPDLELNKMVAAGRMNADAQAPLPIRI